MYQFLLTRVLSHANTSLNCWKLLWDDDGRAEVNVRKQSEKNDLTAIVDGDVATPAIHGQPESMAVRK